MLVAGLDVGGAKKGHAGVALDPSCLRCVAAASLRDDREALAWLRGLEGLEAVGIDAPPRASRSGPEPRGAERELHRLGVRVQWTRAPGQPAAEWMENGERLWRALQKGMPRLLLIEAFPAATARFWPEGPSPLLPLSLVAGSGFRSRADLVDAALAAWTAARHLLGGARAAGTGCSDGPIYY